MSQSRGLSLNGFARCVPTLLSGWTIMCTSPSWTCLGKRLLGNSLTIGYPVISSRLRGLSAESADATDHD